MQVDCPLKYKQERVENTLVSLGILFSLIESLTQNDSD